MSMLLFSARIIILNYDVSVNCVCTIKVLRKVQIHLQHVELHYTISLCFPLWYTTVLYFHLTS